MERWLGDLGSRDGGLERGAWAVAGAVPGTARAQGAAADVPALCGGADRAGRSQERRAHGGAGGAGRLRPVASFHFERRLGRSSAGRRSWRSRRTSWSAARGAFLVIDDTTLPKKGSHSVGVAPQYASALGKTANCQTLVSLTLARDEVPVMVGLRLFLPESWTGDGDRLTNAGVPDEYRSARTKPEIALAEIDRDRAAGVSFWDGARRRRLRPVRASSARGLTRAA